MEADADAATLLSSLGSHAGRPPSPTPSAMLGADPSREQQNLVASVTAMGHSSEAIAVLTHHRLKYPNIHKAFLERSGTVPSYELSEFPITILVPAVHAARIQEHGLLMLRASALAAAPHAGAHGPIKGIWQVREWLVEPPD